MRKFGDESVKPMGVPIGKEENKMKENNKNDKNDKKIKEENTETIKKDTSVVTSNEMPKETTGKRNEISLVDFAKRELVLAGFADKDGCLDCVGRFCVDVCDLADQHRGRLPNVKMAVAEAMASLLVKRSNLTPLQGGDDEWMDLDEERFVNVRHSGVIKEKKTGKCFFMSGILFICQDGREVRDIVDGISVKQEIRRFPFTPKTFKVDVHAGMPKLVDVLGDKVLTETWHVSNAQQLVPVWEYYVAPSGFNNVSLVADWGIGSCY